MCCQTVKRVTSDMTMSVHSPGVNSVCMLGSFTSLFCGMRYLDCTATDIMFRDVVISVCTCFCSLWDKSECTDLVKCLVSVLFVSEIVF